MILDTFDGEKIFINIWDDVDNPKGVVHIIHGMVEYGARYGGFASYLNNIGYIVIAPDHRGHGKTGFEFGCPGYFSDSDGWMKVIRDNYDIYESYKNKGKYFFIGHSMGSFILRAMVNLYDLDGADCIFSGSGNPYGLQIRSGLFLAKVQSTIFGAKKRGHLLNKIMFRGFNSRFTPNRSEFDWLSSDGNQVDKYDKSPWCGFVPTIGFFSDFMNGILDLYKLEKNCNDQALRTLWLFGGEDPVSNGSNDIKVIEEKYSKNSKFIVYKKMRHEILNELDRVKVYKDIADFILRGEKYGEGN